MHNNLANRRTKCGGVPSSLIHRCKDSVTEAFIKSSKQTISRNLER